MAWVRKPIFAIKDPVGKRCTKIEFSGKNNLSLFQGIKTYMKAYNDYGSNRQMQVFF